MASGIKTGADGFDRPLPFNRAKLAGCLPGSQPEKEHTHQDEGQIDGFRTQVALVEQRRTAQERHDDRTAADHRDDGDHGIGIAQGIEVGEVSGREEDRDERDAGPVPRQV